MNAEAERLIEELDAAIFSGDTFRNPEALASLSLYLERWQRAATKITEDLREEGRS